MAPRPAAVRNVRRHSANSGTSLVDDIDLGPVMYHGSRVGMWLCRRWRVTGPLLVLGVLWGSVGVVAVVAFGVLTVVGLTAWLVWKSRSAEGAPGGPVETWREHRQRAALGRQWALACRTAKLLGPESQQPPKLRGLRGTGTGTLTATVESGRVGVPVFAIEKQTAALAEVIGCREVVVTQTGSGVARLAFHWRDPIGRALPLAALPIAVKSGTLAYGIRQDGTVASVRATQSVLIGGLTRMGKSNFVWALLADALRQGMHVDLYVSDPKGGVELDQLESAVGRTDGLLRVRQYAKTPAETVTMLDAAEKGMKARQYWMKQNGARRITPDAVNPLVVIILDETLPLTDILKKGTDSALGRVAYTGAAAAYVVWANTQVAQIDALGRFRDLIPQRVCFATPSPQVTDAVLGNGSEGQGASCAGLREAGVGFSHMEGDKLPRKFRAALVTDRETKAIAEGVLPSNVVNATREAYDRAAEGDSQAGKGRGERRTALYRWFYVDSEEYGTALGYIGISYDVLAREAQHSAGLRAFMEGNVRREVVYYPTRKDAERAEAEAIRAEKPIHNDLHNGSNGRRRLDLRRDKVS